MKQKLLIIVYRLLQGGVDIVLIEYLKRLDREKFEIKLAIGIGMEELEVNAPYIPKDIKMYYLVNNHSLIKYQKQKKIKKLPFLLKLYDEAILNPIRRYQQNHNLKVLINESDIVIDFDSRFYSFLKNYKIPKIAFFHFSFKQYHDANQRKLERLGKKLFTYDKIITICDEMKREGVEVYPSLENKFTTIYNGFNFETIKDKALEETHSSRINLPYLLAIQRLEESQKDTTTLIKAYKLLVDKYKVQEKLYIIGEGKSRIDLENLCTHLNLSDKVIFLGYISNPYPWIKKSKLFILSSKFEGLPTVLIEAMILNKGIVASNCPTGPAEILDYGNAGCLVPVGNEKAMAKAIHKMITDEPFLTKILENSQQYVQRFEIDQSVHKIEKVMLNLLN